MKRRRFLAATSAIAASGLAPRLFRAQEYDADAFVAGTLIIDQSTTFATIPRDFIGVSYVSAQLANPVFFSAKNTALTALFRELSDQGVLRLGGETSEFITGPAMDAKQGVTLTESRARTLHKGVLRIPAYSAILLET